MQLNVSACLFIALDDDDTDHIVSVQLDDEESMAQFLDSHNPDDVRLRSLSRCLIIVTGCCRRAVIIISVECVLTLDGIYRTFFPSSRLLMRSVSGVFG